MVSGRGGSPGGLAVLGQPWVTSVSFSLLVQAGIRWVQGSAEQFRAPQSSSVAACCGSGACRNLKETSALHPENPAPKIVSPDSGAWRLGGPWGREIGSGPRAEAGRGWQRRTNESGCYLDPHGVGMWLDEALDDRRREAIKIRSRPRPLRPGEAADGAVSRL